MDLVPPFESLSNPGRRPERVVVYFLEHDEIEHKLMVGCKQCLSLLAELSSFLA